MAIIPPPRSSHCASMSKPNQASFFRFRKKYTQTWFISCQRAPDIHVRGKPLWFFFFAMHIGAKGAALIEMDQTRMAHPEQALFEADTVAKWRSLQWMYFHIDSNDVAENLSTDRSKDMNTHMHVNCCQCLLALSTKKCFVTSDCMNKLRSLLCTNRSSRVPTPQNFFTKCP